MKTFVTLALTLVLTAVLLVGCGCTNRNIDNTSAPTVLPTNEEIWNTTESTTHTTTESTTIPMTTDSIGGTMDNNTANGGSTDNNSGDRGTLDSNSGTTTETEGTMQRSGSRMMPGTR